MLELITGVDSGLSTNGGEGQLIKLSIKIGQKGEIERRKSSVFRKMSCGLHLSDTALRLLTLGLQQ